MFLRLDLSDWPPPRLVVDTLATLVMPPEKRISQPPQDTGTAGIQELRDFIRVGNLHEIIRNPRTRRSNVITLQPIKDVYKSRW